MLGYLVPLLVVVATVAGALLAFETWWLALLVGGMVAILMPIGDLRGRPAILQLINLPATLRSHRRRKRRRHLYYSP